METRGNIIFVAVLVVAVIASVADSQTVCNVPIKGLMTCIPAAMAPNPSPPTEECCETLKKCNDLCCLLKYRNSPILSIFGVDPDLAIQIPDKCQIAHPPISSCSK